MDIEQFKEKYKNKTYEEYKNELESFKDLLGDGYNDMSILFYLFNKKYLYWLNNNPDISVKEKDILFRRKIYPLIQKIGPAMLGCTQFMENRKYLNNSIINENDDPVVLPKKPVIFVANHGFRDDILATVLAAGRHGYILFGSLPLFYNTIDGLSISLVGSVLVNRKCAQSRSAAIEKSLKVMEYGTDMIFFPEGGWNKTSEKLVLDLWRGVYTLSKNGKYDVVPISHYTPSPELISKKNIIHTVVDNPIPLYEMDEKTALITLRDNLASWQFKMAEIYGKTTRNEEMKNFNNSDEKWDFLLQERMKSVCRYDSSIEKCSDFRSKDIIRADDVFSSTANVKNITPENVKMVEDCKKLVKEISSTDFQRLY